jgi:hypothetical protein
MTGDTPPSLLMLSMRGGGKKKISARENENFFMFSLICIEVLSAQRICLVFSFADISFMCGRNCNESFASALKHASIITEITTNILKKHNYWCVS